MVDSEKETNAERRLLRQWNCLCRPCVVDVAAEQSLSGSLGPAALTPFTRPPSHALSVISSPTFVYIPPLPRYLSQGL